jgi:hypothetical protein
LSPYPSAYKPTSTEPPTSVEPLGGAYCSTSSAGETAEASVLRNPVIGEVAVQLL